MGTHGVLTSLPAIPLSRLNAGHELCGIVPCLSLSMKYATSRFMGIAGGFGAYVQAAGTS